MKLVCFQANETMLNIQLKINTLRDYLVRRITVINTKTCSRTDRNWYLLTLKTARLATEE